jgi:hypothetical protein
VVNVPTAIAVENYRKLKRLELQAEEAERELFRSLLADDVDRGVYARVTERMERRVDQVMDRQSHARWQPSTLRAKISEALRMPEDDDE